MYTTMSGVCVCVHMLVAYGLAIDVLGISKGCRRYLQASRLRGINGIRQYIGNQYILSQIITIRCVLRLLEVSCAWGIELDAHVVHLVIARWHMAFVWK